MLKVLLKKQMAEVFRSYFYNQKKNQPRSKVGVILLFILFGFLMIGILGGMFTAMAIGLCGGLAAAGVGWLYFLLMCGVAILLGAFGSVFNTYSGLYLPKDNDLLLSMPIPVRIIIASRLLNVYLLGTMYCATAMLPALIVYWATVGVTVQNLICGLLLFLIITLIRGLLDSSL
jgi:ABC-2 type transport system permease protein